MAVLHLELEVNFVAFLEGDVEVAGVENLSEFYLDGAQNLVLVEVRADCLPDLSKELVLLCAALRRRA